MPKAELEISFSNFEADYLSDLVVNCETPKYVLDFTTFIEKTISPEMSTYHKEAERISSVFKDRIESLAPEYIQKDEKGVYVHKQDGQPAVIEGEEEDWNNLFKGAREEMTTALNKLGNTVVVYKVSRSVLDNFVEAFMHSPVKTFISLQEKPEEVNRAYLMIYLIAKRIQDASVQTKGASL